jgi:DNA-binding transcriptional regulator YdaS (Cro superfamily)
LRSVDDVQPVAVGQRVDWAETAQQNCVGQRQRHQQGDQRLAR